MQIPAPQEKPQPEPPSVQAEIEKNGYWRLTLGNHKILQTPKQVLSTLTAFKTDLEKNRMYGPAIPAVKINGMLVDYINADKFMHRVCKYYTENNTQAFSLNTKKTREQKAVQEEIKAVCYGIVRAILTEPPAASE